IDHVTHALAAFQRTISHGLTPYERWLNGDDSALNTEAQEGFKLFISERIGCIRCHNGDNFSDQRLWDIGVVTKDRGAGAFNFKTPTLWGVASRGPYMHNGSENTLADVLELYSQGGRVKRPTLSPLIKPLNLSNEEKAQLIAFLQSLSPDDVTKRPSDVSPEKSKPWYENEDLFPKFD
ncbi:MAG: c-type cytochrome, partial [Bdellovibrionaceae bacterium]|nr:c-type cytochrome [Pseudobdellovibrionaceae bacterium]